MNGKLIDPDAYHALQECVHCGFCLPNCPTYKVLGVEADSPRGRIRLMKAYADGEIGISEGLVEHLSLCLVCRNCETVCPSGVKFGLAMDATRQDIEGKMEYSMQERLFRWMIFSFTFSSLGRVRTALKLARLPASKFLMKKLGMTDFLELMGSARSVKHLNPKQRDFYPAEKSAHKVAMLAGCIMSTVLADIDRATIRVLNKNNCAVMLPKEQMCCGALHQHEGEIDRTKALARKNVDAFSKYDLDAIVVNSAGCGATMKEYALLLADDPEYAGKAKTFSSKVKDFAEFLAEIPLNKEFGEVKMMLTYQDPCHLAHAQRIKEEPRKILGMIPGLKIVEMKTPDLCCGAAGIYSALHSELAGRILETRLKEISDTGASGIVASNPPCYIQYTNAFSKNDMKVYHIAELLDMSYRNFRK